MHLEFILIWAMTLTLVSGLPLQCYNCNSVDKPDCGAKAWNESGVNSAVPCGTVDDYLRYTHNHHLGSEVDSEVGGYFVLEPLWVNHSSSYITVCKKMTIKLTSRDPPGTHYTVGESLQEQRDAMPVRTVRYCGIERVTQSHLVGSRSRCHSRIASGKMDVKVCRCETRLCNGTNQTHPFISILLTLLLIYAHL